MTSKINALTGLRAPAALWVVWFHLPNLPSLFPDFLLPIQLKGYLGVDLFFLLSGFVLAYVYHEKFKILSLPGIYHFLKARLARIYPLHLTLLLIYVAITCLSGPLHFNTVRLGEEPTTLDTLIYNLFLIHAWETTRYLSWNVVSWSISAEWFAYLCFPFFICFFWSRVPENRQLCFNLAVILLLSLALASLLLHIHLPLQDWTFHLGLLRVALEFPLGMCLFFIRPYLPSNNFWLYALLVLTIGISLPLVHSKLFDFWLILSQAILILTLSNKGRLTQFFSSPWLVYLGEISYSIYMSHSLIRNVFQYAYNHHLNFGLGDKFFWLLYLVTVLGVSHLLYQIIEVPMRNYIRKTNTHPSRAHNGGDL